MNKNTFRTPEERERRREIREAVAAAGSIGKLAKQCGLSTSTLWSRLYTRRWDLQRAISEPVMSTRERAVARHGCDIDEEAARRGISVSLVRGRMKKGWSAQDALAAPPRRRGSPSRFGVSLVTEAERRGMSKSTLYGRLASGWSLERALNEPVRDKHAPKRRANAERGN